MTHEPEHVSGAVGASGASGPSEDSGGTVVQRHEIPERILALSPLTAPDYVDVFTLTTPEPTDIPPERWARAAFEDVAGLGGQFIWRVLLGLRLARRRRSSPTHIAGWRIAGRGDDWIRVEARSWMLTGHLVVHVAAATSRSPPSSATTARWRPASGPRCRPGTGAWPRACCATRARR
ncbi:hypothetical protein [Streptomyces albiaxialis]|uniref:hypothetical protein n=1 Tax=Streptomyces albiaxialis TaxID=329523 RepID=UPI0031DF348A